MRNKVISSLVVLAIFFTCFVSAAPVFADNSVVITESGGWFESGHVKWQELSGYDGYNVYYKKVDDGLYTKIDDELIRIYPGFWRADVLGLAKGDYILKVVPKNGDHENESLASETGILSVENYRREGYAFFEGSPYGITTGGYLEDGTVNPNSDIVYVTNSNKETVTVGGDETKGVGLYGIMKYREAEKLETPMIIRYLGKVEMPKGTVDYMLGIKETKNITLEGVGDDGTAHGYGFTMKRACNIEVRNLGIMWYGGIGGDGDSLSLDTENKNIWLHNIDFFYGAPGKDADQVKGDGSIDLKQKSDYVTSSYNHFWDSGKACVAGGVWESKNPTHPEAKINITYHHNWFDHSDSRHPRCVAGNVHVYNNYFDGNSKYGIGAAVESSVFVDSNYFRNCPRPMIIATQGSDCWDGSKYTDKGTLSGQTGGMIKSYNNTIIDAKRFYDQNTTPHEGQIDAYTVLSREEQVPASVKAMKGEWSYSNFDTNKDKMYNYEPDTPEVARDKVIASAGRMNGGDFKWEFDNSIEDSNSEVIPELQQAIINYESKLVSVPAIDDDLPDPTSTPDPNATVSPSPTPYVPSGDKITHNFTTDDLSSSFFTFESGSLKTNKGTVVYNDLTLTKGYEMGTGAKTSFVAPRDGEATLVFTTEYGNYNIKINGEKVKGDVNGIVKFDIKSGQSYDLEKYDSSVLFYIDIMLEGGNEPTSTPISTAMPTSTPQPTNPPVPTAEPTAPPTAEPIDFEYKIDDAEYEDGGVSVSVSYKGIAAPSAKLIAAAYSSDRVMTKIEMIDISGAGEYIIANMSEPVDGFVKLFIWDSLNTLVPLSDSKTIDGTQPTTVPTEEPKPTSNSDAIIWRAEKDISVGETLLIPGLSPVDAMVYLEPENPMEIDGETFAGKCVGAVNATKDGKGGASLKFEPTVSGNFTVYAKINNGKTLSIMNESGTSVATYENTSGASEYKALSCDVTSSQTYYAFVYGSRAEFFGVKFDPSGVVPTTEPRPVVVGQWSASKDVEAGEELGFTGFSSVDAMAFTEKKQTVSGKEFAGRCTGAVNASVDGKSGASLKFEATEDGDLSVYYKVNDGKIFTIMDADGTVVASYDNNTGASKYECTSGSVEKGKTYYVFVNGSKAEFYGATFSVVK